MLYFHRKRASEKRHRTDVGQHGDVNSARLIVLTVNPNKDNNNNINLFMSCSEWEWTHGAGDWDEISRSNMDRVVVSPRLAFGRAFRCNIDITWCKTLEPLNKPMMCCRVLVADGCLLLSNMNRTDTIFMITANWNSIPANCPANIEWMCF